MYRIRESANEEEIIPKKAQSAHPCPSSFLPDFYFKNTVPHPFFIFYNLYDLFNKTNDGQQVLQNNDVQKQKPIIEQINEYFNIDILSISQLKVDINQVHGTWNKRFPHAKSLLFTPAPLNLKVSEISDLQSLHLLAFNLNICIYLLFPIGEHKIYNMKLGPDISENDIHFKVFYNVDKSEKNISVPTGGAKIYKKDKWLSFQRIDAGLVSSKPLELSPFISIKETNGKMFFLEIEKRDPIPIIKIPFLEKIKTFQEISLNWCETNDEHSQITFSSKNKENKSPFLIEINITTNEREHHRLAKIKSIATKFRQTSEDRTEENTKYNNFYNDHVNIAETNDSAFFVQENECASIQDKGTNENNQDECISTYNKKYKSSKLSFGGPLNEESITESIISFRDRLKHQLTYDIIYNNGKGHPLIDYLCSYYLFSLMTTSYDFIDEQIKRDKNFDKALKLRVVPIENDDTYYEYKAYVDNDKENWRKIVMKYPQIMSISQIVEKDDETHYNIVRSENDKGDFKSYFEFFYKYIQKAHAKFYKRVLSDFLPRCYNLIQELRTSTIGLNPIVCPVIYNEYMETSKTCCISYYSNQKYNEPVNPLLMRDVRSTDEFLVRTTVKLFDDKNLVEENANNGAFPVKIQTLKTKLMMKKDQQIPDPSFAFKKSFNLLRHIEQARNLESSNNVPNYSYSFFRIDEGKIGRVSLFTIQSKYKLSYIYVSQENVFTISKIENFEFAYGSCKSMDTEVSFLPKCTGIFKSAVYMEEDSCLIICYYDAEIKQFCFTGYDNSGKINNATFPGIEVESMCVLSRNYFASYNAQKEDANGQQKDCFCVFKYNPIKRIVEYNGFSDLWRISDKLICKEILIKKAEEVKRIEEEGKEENKKKRRRVKNIMCFIGNQSDSGNDESTICIYKYDPKNKVFDREPIGKDFNPSLNFHWFNESGNNLQYDNSYISNDDENDEKLLENRIKNNKGASSKDVLIPSMLTTVPLKEDEKRKKLSLLDLHCSLTELFPSPVVIQGFVINFDSSKESFSLYRCDYKVYRIISHQIWGFYFNTRQRLSLFATEMLLYNYNFTKLNIVLIVDTCGLGARLSNLLFGTRFDNKNVLEGDIWSGCSCSDDLASVILLFHVDDIDNIYKAVSMIYPKKVAIFKCQSDGVKSTVKFGYDPKIIKAGVRSNESAVKREISFMNNSELEGKIGQLKVSFKNILKSSIDAVESAKDIVAKYLTFGTFAHYPQPTVEKYSQISVKCDSPITLLFDK